MRPRFGVLNLVQALVYAVLGAYFAPRWLPIATLLWASALLQGLTGALLLTGDRFIKAAPKYKVIRVASWFSLGTIALLIGLHLQLAVHIIQTFTPIGAETAWSLLGAVAVALPWVLVLPLWQLANTKPTNPKTLPKGSGTGLCLILLAFPPALTAQRGAPHTRYAAIDGVEAGEWIWNAWHGSSSTLPQEDNPVAMIRIHLRNGKVIDQQSAEADSLAEALPQLLPASPPRQGDALVLEVLTMEGRNHRPALAPNVRLFNPGTDAFRLETGLQSARRWLASNRIQQVRLDPQLWLPVVNAPSQAIGWTRTQGWVIDSAGAKPLHKGWTAPERLSLPGLERAVHEAAQHLRFHMKPDGKFAYVVKGPSGVPGGGYNFPRHAGGTWFMARVGEQTGDPKIQQGAQAAADFLATNTVRLNDGRAYVIDPNRKDGKAWVGTTALALLGFVEAKLHPDLQVAYAAFLASAVDEQGKVLGDLDRETEEFPPQPAVTYAQGQVLLALAAADEAQLPGVSAALERAATYVDGPYWPLPAARMGILDEHWMCIAADRLDRMGRTETGRSVCEAYLANQMDLNAQSPLAMPAGPAGGIAEAWMGAALMDARDGVFGRHFDQALEYGELLWAQRYRPADAAFLPRPEALLGGFRDNAWNLDVRVDAVQHIGFALLGLTELLRLQPSGLPS
jgi:hypothetical protein